MHGKWSCLNVGTDLKLMSNVRLDPVLRFCVLPCFKLALSLPLGRRIDLFFGSWCCSPNCSYLFLLVGSSNAVVFVVTDRGLYDFLCDGGFLRGVGLCDEYKLPIGDGVFD